MRILLPSKGLHGQYVVDTRVPTFKDIYEIQDNSQDDLVQKFTFVKKVTTVDFNKVTYDDVMYLFTLLSFSLLNNRIGYDFECKKCKEKYKHFVQLGDQEIIQLKVDNSALPYSRRLHGHRYTYTIPTAQQIFNAYDLAQYEDDEERAYLDLQVAAIMEHVGNREYAKKLPVSVYAAALVFQELYYHGIKNISKAVCPKCHAEEEFKFSVSSSVLSFDRDAMISRYVSVQGDISFADFMSMSVRAFNTFVSELNKRDGQ